VSKGGRQGERERENRGRERRKINSSPSLTDYDVLFGRNAYFLSICLCLVRLDIELKNLMM
jgi:hypothetical protein